MKKFYSLLAALFAMALVVAAPGTAITSHAMGFNPDAPHNESGGDTSRDGYDDDYWNDSGSSDSGSSDSGSHDSGSSDNSGSSNNGSHDSSSSNSSSSGESNAAPSGDNSNGSGTATAPSGLATKGNTKAIDGFETFRQINMPKDGRVAIYHCGIEQYTAQLMGADGKAVAYKSASPYKDEATGKWYLNLVTENGVDTTGYTIGTWKGSVDYLPKLGMSGVMLNQTVVVDAEATAEAVK